MVLSRTAQNYLRVIYSIIEGKGYVRVKDISGALAVRPPTTIEMLEKLNVAGLIVYEKRGGIMLTEEGKKTAAGINERYMVFLRLFELAGVSPKTAYHDACILEHYISDETNNAIHDFIDRLERAGVANPKRPKI